MKALVTDASMLVAALVDEGPEGRWAEELLASADHRIAPQHALVETANILRRLELAGALPPDIAARAYEELTRLDLELYPYLPLSHRIWELRLTVTCYDAWYVALAEAVDAPLATLDTRLAGASGPSCEFLVPGA
jgi:predicted nucleic acid-binding protein